MNPTVATLPSIEALTEFIRQALCEHDRLDPQQTPLFHTSLRRGDSLCGVLFHIDGPRLLKNSAIWAGDEHRILFYDCNGVRFREVRLSESPALSEECAIAVIAAPSA